MRAPAVVVAVASLVLQSVSAPAPAAAASFQAWLIYEDALGEEQWRSIPLKEIAGEIRIVEDWAWQCTEQCADDGFRINDLDLMLDPDPVITFGVAVTDFGAASTFGFVFSQPIVATAAPGTATSSLSGSTTNGGGAPGSVTVTPAAPPGSIPQDNDGVEPNEIMVYTLSTDGGTSWQNVGIDLGPAFASDSGLVSDDYGAYNAGPVAGPAGTGFYDAMRVDVNFMLSGGGDIFTFNGDATIVPEPRAVAMITLGLLGIALARRRHR